MSCCRPMNCWTAHRPTDRVELHCRNASRASPEGTLELNLFSRKLNYFIPFWLTPTAGKETTGQPAVASLYSFEQSGFILRYLQWMMLKRFAAGAKGGGWRIPWKHLGLSWLIAYCIAFQSTFEESICCNEGINISWVRKMTKFKSNFWRII